MGKVTRKSTPVSWTKKCGLGRTKLQNLVRLYKSCNFDAVVEMGFLQPYYNLLYNPEFLASTPTKKIAAYIVILGWLYNFLSFLRNKILNFFVQLTTVGVEVCVKRVVQTVVRGCRNGILYNRWLVVERL